MDTFATVILPIPNEQGFTYRVPDHLLALVRSGMQVIVPFGRRHASGIVLEVTATPPAGLKLREIKPISDIVAEQPVVSDELLKLLKWLSDYYICHLGESMRLVQSQLNVGTNRLVVVRSKDAAPRELPDSLQKICDLLKPERAVSLANLRTKLPGVPVGAQLARLEKMGLVHRKFLPPTRKTALQKEQYFRAIDFRELDEQKQSVFAGVEKRRTSKARAALQYLQSRNWVSLSELKSAGFATAVLNRLLEKGLVEKEERKKERAFNLPYDEFVPDVELTAEQVDFVQKAGPFLSDQQFRVFLLHGITGSGKTQIYIELIRRALELGRQAIVLIPEIVLTPQTMARFRYHLGDRVGMIHSRLTAAEKREMLHQVRAGRFDVVIGPRSAVFAPLQNPGLIVVDEEHETSYKQTDAQPRYHARDVAVYRAHLNNAVVVLGSATPSFESLYNAEQGRYEYVQLMKRIEARELPRISMVDLRQDWKRMKQIPVVSENLELQIETRLLLREQIMILQNRRGYAPYLLCRDCGAVSKCPHCEITLTYHQTSHKLLCHYCGYNQKAPDVCPECQGLDILYRGIGTQRLEEVLKETFPETKIIRMDQDTTRGRHGHMKLLEQFRNGGGQILLGTKMIAKGLDFERVTLVGIVSADQGLHFPDFRANERVFQLLTQAAGRAGRGASSGTVVVQTFDPAHYIFNFLLTHDYSGFYHKELESRKTLKYPPFSRLILIRIEGINEKQVELHARAVGQFLWKLNSNKSMSILGPSPAPLYKIQDNYRYQLLIKHPRDDLKNFSRVRRAIKNGLYQNPDVKKWPVKLFIDVEPVEIL